MSDENKKISADEGGSRSRSKSPRPAGGNNSDSDNGLAELRRRRGVFKGRLTLFDKYISSLGRELDANGKVELQMRIDSTVEMFKNYSIVQNEIEQIALEDDLVSNLQYRDQFESSYYRLIAAAKCILSENEQKDSILTLPSASSVKVKLPQIKLPTFDGSYNHWLEFRNSYITMIHDRKDLDPIHKFHYLRSSLSSTALRVISALEFTAPNYAHAWDLLEKRFHNNRLLVQNHVKSLFSTQSLNKECPSQIRQLIDATLRDLRALESLDEPTNSWDTLITYLIASRLDPTTEREWETHKGLLLADSPNHLRKLKLDDLLTFLRNRADMLDMIKPSSSKRNLSPVKNKPYNEFKQSNEHRKQVASTHTYSSVASNNKGTSSQTKSYRKQARTCTLCNGDHVLYTCANFLNMSVDDRWKLIKEKNICHNCIRDSHSPNECVFGPCKLCQNKHNTLLHSDNNTSCHTSACPAQNGTPPLLSMRSAKSADSPSPSAGTSDESRSVMTSNTLQPVLLSTALVELADHDNNYHTVRALLDNGSQNCFITERLCQHLNCPKIQSTIRICGVGQSVSQSTHSCHIRMRSKTYAFETGIQCLVLPSITTTLPSRDIDVESICIPSHIRLADPNFNISSEVDMLIGADIFWDLLCNNKLRLPSGPYLHESKLGWIISGPINRSFKQHVDSVQCNLVKIESQLRKFWELEEISNPPYAASKEDRACEALFLETTERDENGRFLVRMPLKESADSLGESYSIAKNRFLSLERKLDRAQEYKQLYCDFLREYEELGHMSLVPGGIKSVDKPYYILPHHGVYRESSTTTKLRVVFAANTPTTSNKSLNDIQHVGPPLQSEIFAILLRFRQYQYVACADIEKMYRQILIQSDQRNLQLILWRTNKDKPLEVYRLNTVTYGTTSAPFLSIRCLKRLAQECDDKLIARVIDEDFYIDDLITGNDDQKKLLDICDKTTKVLNSACLPLRKWMFNYITAETTKDLSVGEHCNSKTLGLGWSNKTDELNFTTKVDVDNSAVVTKRLMLSVISQIYDPLGLLSPAIITAKTMLQKLWLCKLDWDDEVSADIASQWHDFISELQYIHEIRVPRYVMTEPLRHKQLHIFTDASIDAYGACAYIRSFNNDDSITVRLLCAKTKLAPLRTISVPRLELCGALVGAKLYNKIVNSLRLEFDKVYFWTDSTIVQGWIRTSPHLLKTFVQNRVSEINTLTGDSIWRHVKGIQNPADLLSRGVPLASLKYDEASLWWCGPAYLHEPDSNWSNYRDDPVSVDLPELKSQTTSFLITEECPLIDFDRFSSFNRLKRTGAYCLRFIHNARRPAHRKTGSLTPDELHSSVMMLTRVAQLQSFPDEYRNLQNSLPVKIKRCKLVNRISGLNIFMDHDSVIRIGGRLDNSTSFSYDKKHPMLLSSKHKFAVLLCTYEHKRLLHAGPQLLVSTMREQWWVLGARNLARQVVHSCVTCARFRGQTLTPMMGSLPKERIEPTTPFNICGVDNAGPMLVLNRKGRGAQLVKCYICLFVCFTTRAIHLELVGSLSTQDYLLAFKRFISRRGKPSVIFSDNGKNFVGAEKELSAISNSRQVIDYASENGIRISFIPPYSPHHGGLWEAGVKSCKYHLRRIMGNAKLTHEEFITVLSQIEAVLNSRPLSPLSADPNDYLPLTPGHFLIGRPLTTPASDDLTSKATTHLSRYDRVEQLRQHFWERWSKEYVSELQRRTKWQTSGAVVAPGSLVMIKEDNLPPLKWRMGRIERFLPGRDEISRVADIRTASGIIRRTCTKICPLPIQTGTEECGQDDQRISLTMSSHQLEGITIFQGGRYVKTAPSVDDHAQLMKM